MHSKRAKMKALCVLWAEKNKNKAVETKNYDMEILRPKHHNIKISRPK